MNNKEFNAKISKAHLGFEDHGILTSYICWSGDGCGGGFGGLGLGGPCMSIWVQSILELFEYKDWSQLDGTLIRVRQDSAGFSSKTIAIGHIIEDRWVTIDEIKEKMAEEIKKYHKET